MCVDIYINIEVNAINSIKLKINFNKCTIHFKTLIYFG